MLDKENVENLLLELELTDVIEKNILNGVFSFIVDNKYIPVVEKMCKSLMDLGMDLDLEISKNITSFPSNWSNGYKVLTKEKIVINILDFNV